MKVAFITTNKHKFQEVQDILREYPIELEHENVGYEEDQDDSLEEIARKAAQKLSNKLNKPVILEDSGLFFEAYDGFPGSLTKFAINTLGFKGIFKLLEGESQKAYFKTVAAFCHPGEEPILFEGTLHGKMTTEVHNEEKDVMPYDKIFIPEGHAKTISDLSVQEKNALSSRGEAFRKFGKYISKQIQA